MKRIYFIIIIILLTNSNIWAQEIPKEMRKSNTMVIQLEQTSDEILNLAAKALVQFDYEIEKLDKEFLTISTKPRLIKNILNYYIKVKSLDNQQIFKYILRWTLQFMV